MGERWTSWVKCGFTGCAMVWGVDVSAFVKGVTSADYLRLEGEAVKAKLYHNKSEIQSGADQSQA